MPKKVQKGYLLWELLLSHCISACIFLTLPPSHPPRHTLLWVSMPCSLPPSPLSSSFLSDATALSLSYPLPPPWSDLDTTMGPESGSSHVARVSATVSCHHHQSLHSRCQLHKRPHNFCSLAQAFIKQRQPARPSGQEVHPGTTSPGRVSGRLQVLVPGAKELSSLPVFAALNTYSRTTCYVFSLKGQMRSSPFKIRIPLLFVSFWNTMRTDWGHGWAVNASYPASTAPFLCQKESCLS